MRLHRTVWGDGKTPALLLHGFTSSLHSWDHLRPLLGPHLKAVAVDLPGHGLSGECADLQSALDAVEAVLDDLGILSAHLLGYSMGARLALGLALRIPNRIRCLVLESGNPGLRSQEQRAARAREDALLADEVEAEGIEEFVERWEARPLFSSLRRLPIELSDALKMRRLASRPRGLASALRVLGLGTQPNYWGQLVALRIPALVIAGSEDAKFSALALSIAAALPLGTAKIFDGCGHAPHLEQPSEYAREVLTFFGAQGPRADLAPCTGVTT